MRRLFLIMVCLLFFLAHGAGRTAHNAYANNISVSNPTITGQDGSSETAEVQFDISWENSWRNSVNYDAAWVFVKYSTDGGTTWAHATLKSADGDTNPLDDGSGWSAGSGTVLQMVIPSSSSDKKGVFLQRSSSGSGSVDTDNIQLVWDWGADKLSEDPDTDITGSTTARVKVFAIEMVHIPEGTFSAGSGGSEDSCFTKTMINTANATTAPSGDPLSGGYPSGQTAPSNASWPNGYSAFYIMKYDISQGQYADFLNVITSVQASSRYPNQNGNYRHTISGSHPSYSASRPDRACNYLSWADLYAYADWAGLRPFTELEYEKAARGTASAVANEYAWGTATIVPSASLTISGAEDGTETITTDVSLGACLYGNKTFSGGDGGTGPLRCGIFAKSDTTRITSGASYYGVMDLSGGLWKRPVTVGNAEGRVFTGIHGDGDLTTFPSGWPSSSTAAGSGFRGGAWTSGATLARVSDRRSAAYTSADRFSGAGGRCARTP
jgi:hypothetical protein